MWTIPWTIPKLRSTNDPRWIHVSYLSKFRYTNIQSHYINPFFISSVRHFLSSRVKNGFSYLCLKPMDSHFRLIPLKPKHSVHLTRSPSLSVRSNQSTQLQSCPIHTDTQSRPIHTGTVQSTTGLSSICPNHAGLSSVLFKPRRIAVVSCFKTFT